jgi:hypothetical protein
VEYKKKQRIEKFFFENRSARHHFPPRQCEPAHRSGLFGLKFGNRLTRRRKSARHNWIITSSCITQENQRVGNELRKEDPRNQSNPYRSPKSPINQ